MHSQSSAIEERSLVEPCRFFLGRLENRRLNPKYRLQHAVLTSVLEVESEALLTLDLLLGLPRIKMGLDRFLNGSDVLGDNLRQDDGRFICDGYEPGLKYTGRVHRVGDGDLQYANGRVMEKF